MMQQGIDVDLQRPGAVRHVLRRGYVVIGTDGQCGASQHGGKDGGGERVAVQGVLSWGDKTANMNGAAA